MIDTKGVFRTQSNIYDGRFCENIFLQKSYIVDVRLGSKYTSEYRLTNYANEYD